GDGVRWVGLAVEGDHARAGRDDRRLEPAHEAPAHAVALEAAAPLVGPVADLALPAQVAGDELLLVAHLFHHPGVALAQMVERVGVRADGEAVDRGVAGAVLLVPLLDHHEFARVLEEWIEAVD